MAAIQRDPNGQIDFGRGELFIQVVILLSLIALAVETLPGLTNGQRLFVAIVEKSSIIVFTVEYLARFLGSQPRRSYALSFFGIIDLLAILPFYIGLGIDLRGLRALRLLRLFRILKLARYSRAMRRLHRAFVISREEIVLFLSAALILLYLAGLGIYYFENAAQPDVFTSILDGLWWATASLTTVGYGDSYPVTAGGKVFTFLVLIVGLGVVAVPTGLVASALSAARREEAEQSEEISR